MRYINEVLFVMVKKSTKYTYLCGKTTIALKNDVSTFRKIYYDKDNRVMVNQSINESFILLLYTIDVLT